MLGCLCKARLREEGATHWQMEKLEIRAVIKFFCKKGMPPKEIHEDFIKTLGKGSPSYSNVKKWAAEFQKGRNTVEVDGWPGHPKDATADENVKGMHNFVMCDKRRDPQSIAIKMGISFGAVQSILTDILGMSKVSARWMLQMLTDDQTRTRLDISRYLLCHLEDDRA